MCSGLGKGGREGGRRGGREKGRRGGEGGEEGEMEEGSELHVVSELYVVAGEESGGEGRVSFMQCVCCVALCSGGGGVRE